MHVRTQDLNLTVRRCQPFKRIVAAPQVTSGIFSNVHLLFVSSASFRSFEFSRLRSVTFEPSVVAKSQVLCLFDVGPDI
jgi:hypothetical protein